MEFIVRTENGEYDLEAGVRWIGADLLVAVWGGDTPHIGAVSAAQPRPSLKDPEKISATASVICYTGHKEDALAKHASEKLASALNTRVVVTAGMHWDHISERGIRCVMANSGVLVDLILSRIEAGHRPGSGE